MVNPSYLDLRIKWPRFLVPLKSHFQVSTFSFSGLNFFMGKVGARFLGKEALTF
jgi:hypothetical protein